MLEKRKYDKEGNLTYSEIQTSGLEYQELLSDRASWRWYKAFYVVLGAVGVLIFLALIIY